MVSKMVVDGDCISVAHHIGIRTEDTPLSPASSQKSESDVPKKGRGEQLDLEKVIKEQPAKISMKQLRKAVPELYRKCYEHKKCKRKVKYTWDPSNKPKDWPDNTQFVDPNNGVKGGNGCFSNKPTKKELLDMFIFVRNKYILMSTSDSRVEKTVEETQMVKSILEESNVSEPSSHADLDRITYLKDKALIRMNDVGNPDPYVQSMFNRMKTDLCGSYNRLVAKQQDMQVYMDFVKLSYKIEELIDNMGIVPMFVTTHFERHAQEILDDLKKQTLTFGGGIHQEMVSVQAIQVHGVASTDDVAKPYGLSTLDQSYMQSSHPHVNTTSQYTEASSGKKMKFGEKKHVPEKFEKSTPFQDSEKTVGYCSVMNVSPQYFEELYKAHEDVIKMVADDDDNMKYAPTSEELFNQLQVQLRPHGTEHEADVSRQATEKELETPSTVLYQESPLHEGSPLPMDEGSLPMEWIEGCEDQNIPGGDQLWTQFNSLDQLPLQGDLETLERHTFKDVPVGMDTTFGIQRLTPIPAVTNDDITYSTEIPSMVEEFNDPDIAISDTSTINSYPD